MEEWIRIRELDRRGVSVSEIARLTGRDRKTVRKVLEGTAPKLEWQVTEPRESKRAPFREYLLQRIDQGCLNGTVLLEEITRLGYTGKIAILRELLTTARMRVLLRPKLLVIDEGGYLPLDRPAANWFFELVSPRPTYYTVD